MSGNDKVVDLEKRVEEESRDALDLILREGAQKMLQLAVEAEVADYIESHKDLRDPQTGHRLVVRNGHQPERAIQSGLGPVTVEKPRVNDRRENKKFTSNILPPYMRKTPSVEALIPVLYLKGISTNDFPEALKAILGKDAAGLSPSSISRLKTIWRQEYEEWNNRDLSDKKYVYWWVDGIYFNVRLTDERPCLLVIVGTLEDGTKELVGIWDGERESKALVAGASGGSEEPGRKQRAQTMRGRWSARLLARPRGAVSGSQEATLLGA